MFWELPIVMEQAFDGFRTQNMAPTMVKPRKKDTPEEMSYLVAGAGLEPATSGL